MNKFKVGDRVAVYGPFPFKGKLISINDSTGYLSVTEDGFYSCHNDSPFHPKQCRKLVKKKKLEACGFDAMKDINVVFDIEATNDPGGFSYKQIPLSYLAELIAEAIRAGRV